MNISGNGFSIAPMGRGLKQSGSAVPVCLAVELINKPEVEFRLTEARTDFWMENEGEGLVLMRGEGEKGSDLMGWSMLGEPLARGWRGECECVVRALMG